MNLPRLLSKIFAVTVAAMALAPRPAHGWAIDQVAEAVDFVVVYREALPNTFAGGAVSYDVDNSLTIGASFDRVAYYVELQVGAGPLQWLYVSFDRIAGMTAANKTGIPVLSSGEVFQQLLMNMNVASNVAGIVTGTGLSTGNIEFWSTNYSQPNGIGVPNASPGNFDFGDTRTAGTYGSMQIHNHDLDGAGPGTAGQTLFAYNRFGGTGGNADLGIGNSPTANADWTFAQNATTYTIKNIEVLVRPVPEPSGAMLALLGSALLLGRRRLRIAKRQA